jgi:hypothetical protein
MRDSAYYAILLIGNAINFASKDEKKKIISLIPKDKI